MSELVKPASTRGWWYSARMPATRNTTSSAANVRAADATGSTRVIHLPPDWVMPSGRRARFPFHRPDARTVTVSRPIDSPRSCLPSYARPGPGVKSFSRETRVRQVRHRLQGPRHRSTKHDEHPDHPRPGFERLQRLAEDRAGRAVGRTHRVARSRGGREQIPHTDRAVRRIHLAGDGARERNRRVRLPELGLELL